MIEVRGVSKRFGDFLALDDLSFTVPDGRILGFLGPNGAGKSTTMKIISGFMPPTEGAVLLGGIDMAVQPLKAKRIIGYLPENPPLYYDMTVDEYLRYAGELKGLLPDVIAARRTIVKDQCGLQDRSRSIIGTLSKGYKQRTGIAQALIGDPEVLILDEPTIGLDPRQIGDIRALIKSLAGRCTVILSTHILSEVTLICDDIIFINRGKIVFERPIAGIGSAAELEALFLAHAFGAGLPAEATVPEAAP